MSLLTFITDFGKNSYNIAALKGAILSMSPDSRLVDISNEISNFDIVEGSFILENSYNFFPEKTIHIIAINSFYASRVRLLLYKQKGYFFIAPDNGILSLLFDEIDISDLRYLEYGIITGDLYKNIAKFVQEINSLKNFSEIGSAVNNYNKRISIRPIISGNTIRATIIYIDKFGNCILNIKKEKFEQIRAGRNFELRYSPKNTINKISQKYSDVSFGDELCIFNTAGYLEIAVNTGSALEMLGLEKGSVVQITFIPN